MLESHSLSIRRGIALILLGAICVVLTACGSGSSTAVPKNGVAVVGKDVITTTELADFLASAKVAASQEGQTLPATGTAAYRTFRDQAVGYLVDAAMYEQQAVTMGVGVSAAQVAAAISAIKTQEFAGSETKLQASMKAAGVSAAEFNRQERLTVTEEHLQNKLLAPVKVTATEEKAYYAAHKSSYLSKGKLKPFPKAQPSIRTTLLHTKQAAVVAAWQKTTAALFCAGKVTYNPAYKPTGANDPCSASATGKATTSTPSP
jgi:parvulin-like peptidyl-prolyl isomerase